MSRKKDLGVKPFTHRLGCETNKAVWELHEDAVGHDVLDPANQLHSNFDFREVLGNHSFLQRPSHCWLLGKGLGQRSS